MTQAKGKAHGGAALEFALLTVFWLPLLLGTLAIGTNMVRALQAVQVARDVASMYARGVDFSLPGNQAVLVWLGSELGMAPSGADPPGDGVAILSTISYIGRYQCKAFGLADDSTPPVPSPACTNYGHFVFTHRLVIGNSSLRDSNYGSPPSWLVNPSTGYISNLDYVTDPGARADAFDLLPKPNEDGTDGFQAGSFAYLVEVYFKGWDTPGFMTGMGSYAHALF